MTERERIVAAIDRDLLIDLAVQSIEIPSPTGYEENYARFLVDQMSQIGFEAELQEIYEGRYNAAGIMKGDDAGATVLLSGHMDTSVRGDESWLEGPGFKNKAIIADGVLLGNGIFNMKNAFACYLTAMRTIQEVIGPLPGSVVLAGTSGEIETAPIDEFCGRAHDGYGVGLRYLLTHGYTADYHILGEPTGLVPILGNWGTCWAKITTAGEFAHTAWSDAHLNAIEEMWLLWRELDSWITGYRAANGYMNIPAQVNRAAIRGGHPWRASRTPASCSMYIDIRVPPDRRMIDVQREFAAEVDKISRAKLKSPAHIKWYMSRPGTVVDPSEQVVTSVTAAHEAVFGSKVEPNFGPPFCSDASDSNRYGIPTVLYGQGRTAKTQAQFFSKDVRTDRGEFVNIDDMVQAACVYALAIIDLLRRPRKEGAEAMRSFIGADYVQGCGT